MEPKGGMDDVGDGFQLALVPYLLDAPEHDALVALDVVSVTQLSHILSRIFTHAPTRKQMLRKVPLVKFCNLVARRDQLTDAFGLL